MGLFTEVTAPRNLLLRYLGPFIRHSRDLLALYKLSEMFLGVFYRIQRKVFRSEIQFADIFGPRARSNFLTRQIAVQSIETQQFRPQSRTVQLTRLFRLSVKW